MIWGWDCNDLGMGLQSFGDGIAVIWDGIAMIWGWDCSHLGMGLQSFGDGIAVIWGWDCSHLGMGLQSFGDAFASFRVEGCTCNLGDALAA